MSEWSHYDFTVGASNFRSSPLTEIFHITHVDEAINAVSKNGIRARPVYDESRLNRSRVHVVWFSPNDWAQGSFYGNIRFYFDWNTLVEKRKLFWVEVIQKYNPHAVRFLLTDKQPDALDITAHVQAYDPDNADGPLKRKDGDWFWNPQYTLEIMVEADIDLGDCIRIDVVKHHDHICRIHKNRCPEQKRPIKYPAAEFLGYLVGAEKHNLDNALTTKRGPPSHERYHSDLQNPLEYLCDVLSRQVEFSGNIKSKMDAESMVKASLLNIAFGQRDTARSVLSLISSEKKFEDAYVRIMRDHFQLPGIKLIR